MGNSNMLSNADDQAAIKHGMCWLAKEKIAERIKRNFSKEFYDKFLAPNSTELISLPNVIGQLSDAHDIEMRQCYRLLGILGCLPKSIADTDIYVDGTLGSDETGDGSETNPFASLNFLSTLPSEINHKYRILLLDDIIVGNIGVVSSLGSNGSISIIGVGVPDIVTTSAGAGPFTIVSTNSLTADAKEINFAEVWGVDELYGKFLRVDSGAFAGYVVPIHKNYASQLLVRDVFGVGVLTGETVTIVEPSVSMHCQSFSISTKSVYEHQEWRGSRFVLANLNIDIRGSSEYVEQIVFGPDNLVFASFCRIISGPGQSGIFVCLSNLNVSSPTDQNVLAMTNSGLTNLDLDLFNRTCGLSTYNTDFPFIYAFAESYVRGSNHFASYDSRSRLLIQGNWRTISRCSLSHIQISYSGGGYIDGIYFSGRADGASVTASANTLTDLAGCWFDNGQDIIQINTGTIRIQACDARAGVFTRYGCYMDGAAKILFFSSPANLAAAMTGAGTSEVYWKTLAAGVAYPAINTSVTDGVASWVAYVP